MSLWPENRKEQRVGWSHTAGGWRWGGGEYDAEVDMRGNSCTFGADGAAFTVGDFWVGAVGCILANHLVAHDASAVADADLARLGFPNIFVVVQLAVQRTAAVGACAGQQHNMRLRQ